MKIICLNAWGGTLHDQLLAYLGDSAPDILCLQEVVHTPASGKDWLTYRDGAHVLPQRANLFAEVASVLSSHVAIFCPAAQGVLWDGGDPVPSQWGIATFVRRDLPVIAQAQGFVHKTYSHDGYGAHPRSRSAHAVRVHDPSAERAVVVAHMHGLRDLAGKHDTSERLRQARRFRNLAMSVAEPGDPVVACGDFNVGPDSRTFAILAEVGLRDLVHESGASGTRTSHYRKPGRFADYMLVNDAVPVRDFQVITDPEVSDHCPLQLLIRGARMADAGNALSGTQSNRKAVSMSQSDTANRRIVLAERPKGLPDENTLRLETTDIPEPGEGEMALRTVFLSLDPYMRGRMNDAKSYAAPVGIGEVMTGQVVAEVVRSNIDGFAPGDMVLAGSGWQDWAVSDGTQVMNLGKSPENPSWALGILGMPGYTAYAGLTYIGEPKAGETVVVAAASGPVGATVGQIAGIRGCRVVGIAGGPEKCRHVVDTLGFDACIDHKSDDFADRLRAACPDGIDVYFENVGGRVLYAVLPLLNPFARVPVCGVVSWYNLTGLPDGPDHGPQIVSTILKMKVKMQGFIIFDSFPISTYQEFREEMTGWLKEGRIQYREQVVDGLESAPAALNDVLTGRNFGKVVVRVG